MSALTHLMIQAKHYLEEADAANRSAMRVMADLQGVLPAVYPAVPEDYSELELDVEGADYDDPFTTRVVEPCLAELATWAAKWRVDIGAYRDRGHGEETEVFISWPEHGGAVVFRLDFDPGMPGFLTFEDVGD